MVSGLALVGLVTACQDAATSTAPVREVASSAPTHIAEPTTAAAAVPSASSRTAHAEVAEPNRNLTPGSVFSSATQAQVCVSGYSRTVRNVSTATRRVVFRSYGIAYPPPAGAYELDHLIPLELGGDNRAQNLWPQPYHHGPGAADVKDHLENHLHALVCSGQVALQTAQVAISSDWYTAAARYNPMSVTARTAPAPAPAASVTTGDGATARCNDGTYSYAAHHQGACSHHGGVAEFYR
jgi:hypothetical protein